MAQTPFDVFRTFLAAQINEFERREGTNKSRHRRNRLFVALCGAATTILLGMKGVSDVDWQNTVTNFALFFSAMTSVVATWDAIFDHRSVWLRCAYTLTELKVIQSDLEHQAAINSDDLAALERLRERASKCLAETNNWLLESRKSKDIKDS